MMQVATSTGDAVKAIEALPEREDLYSMGIIQNEGEIKAFKPDAGGKNFTMTSPAYLAKNTPPPFDKEISGGQGKVIHHKLVVCDFNGDNPVVFCGSSNLAAGGETGNSDNLMAIYDRDVAVMFAVETIRQYQHFRFRSKQEKATEKKPMQLDETDAWAMPFYEKGDIYERERQALMYEREK
jgi:phosphatidylserine/phosphatidylglycerophosphate/cardiolipin synthase-like enzyme